MSHPVHSPADDVKRQLVTEVQSDVGCLQRLRAIGIYAECQDVVHDGCTICSPTQYPIKYSTELLCLTCKYMWSAKAC